MLANIVQELMEYVKNQHGKYNGKDVDYGMRAEFIARREDPTHPSLYTSLEFRGTVLGFTPSRSMAWGHGPASSFGGKEIVQSVKDLVQRLAIGSYKIEFPGHLPNDIRIKILGPSLELIEEIGEIKSVFGQPKTELY